MKKVTILLAVLVLVVCTAGAKDAQKHNIKTTLITGYVAEKTADGWRASQTTASQIVKQIYNKDGLVAETLFLGNGGEVQSKSVAEIAKKRIQKEVYHDLEENTSNETIYSYPEDGVEEKTEHDSQIGMTTHTKTFFEGGKEQKSIITILLNVDGKQQVTASYTLVYEYDEQGRVSKTTQTDNRLPIANLIATTDYEYLESDARGNWIRRVNIITVGEYADEVRTLLQNREIEYYK